MKYVYVVTRVLDRVTPGVINVPNLGVHSSLNAATKHYLAVCQDRTSKKFVVARRLDSKSSVGRSQVVLQTYFPNHQELVMLERWTLLQNKKAQSED